MTSPLPLTLEAGTLAAATSGLHKRFRNLSALTDVNLQVPEGSAYLLVGPNGAGKTTLLKVLLDLVRPSSGDASVFGFDSLPKRARRSIPNASTRWEAYPASHSGKYTA